MTWILCLLRIFYFFVLLLLLLNDNRTVHMWFFLESIKWPFEIFMSFLILIFTIRFGVAFCRFSFSMSPMPLPSQLLLLSLSSPTLSFSQIQYVNKPKHIKHTKCTHSQMMKHTHSRCDRHKCGDNKTDNQFSIESSLPNEMNE